MNDHNIENLSRRRILQAGLGVSAGLTIGFHIPASLAAQSAPGKTVGGAAAGAFEPNAFIKIGIDNSVTVLSKHLEMGQGTYTGLATLVAEELDADWNTVKVIGAPADASRYNNLFWGPAQGTGGSTAMANSWEQMRKAGSAARAMLVSAAAKQWKVKATEITVSNGVVMHQASGRKASFGELAELAAAEQAPANVVLKDPKDFKLIGKTAKRRDSIEKTNGTAKFTQDVKLPGMLVAVVAHPPKFGATVKSLDSSAAKAIKGVSDVVQIPQGVAVLALDTWTAKKGRDALKIEWDESKAFTLSSSEITQRYKALAETPGTVAKKTGNADEAFKKAARVLSKSYDFPFLAHAAMEPMNCVVNFKDGACEIWNGEQMHTGDQYAVAKVLGIEPARVKINTLYAGGSFGRRASKDADYVVEAAFIAKAINGRAPVKMIWMREDDTRAGYYRPAFHHKLEAALDAAGNITGWRHRLVGQSIATGSGFEPMLVKDGVDGLSVEGASNLPYAIPNLTVDLHTPKDIGVPVLWWRSVGSTHTAFSTETFLDEIAVSTGKDPVAMRLELLKNHPRHTAVLKLAAEKAGWGKPLKSNRMAGTRVGRGIAVHESFNSVVAQVAEVTVSKDGSFKVDRVVTAVDCGTAINPDIVRAQVEGSVGFALSAMMYSEITLDKGAVVQGNFDTYPQLRIQDMPVCEVHIVPSNAAPSGIGEPAVPPVAPAVANAIAAATGKRITQMPVPTADLKA